MITLNGLSFNVAVNLYSGKPKRPLSPPELLLEVTYDSKKQLPKYKLTNISKENLYQLDLYLYEDGLFEEVVQPINTLENINQLILQPGKLLTISNPSLFEQCGAMAKQQHWAEYSDSAGNLYRVIYEQTPSGRTQVYPPLKIKKRTDPYHAKRNKKNILQRNYISLRHPVRSIKTVWRNTGYLLKGFALKARTKLGVLRSRAD